MSTISASTTSTTGYVVTSDTTGTLVLQTGASPTTAVYIDSSQNVGIGATPTGFPSGGTLTLPADKAITSAGNGFTLGNNWYYNGGDKFAGTGYATQYYQYSGTHRWLVSSASGSVGGAVTFNEAMRIDSSGNVGIGTSSPDAKLTLKNPNVSGEQTVLDVHGATNTTKLLYASVNQTTDVVNFGTGYGAPLAFVTNSTERMRIDSSGNLLVGATGLYSNGKVEISQTGNAQGLVIHNSSASQTGAIQTIYADRNTTNGTFYTYAYYNTTAAAYKFYVIDSGAIYSTSTSITAISDQSLKTNIRDLDTGLTQVMALKPRRFDWENGDGQDIAGFIAQEVEQVLPDLVSGYRYNEEETKKALRMGDMLPTLVKAIQEQQAIITTLTERISALENK